MTDLSNDALTRAIINRLHTGQPRIVLDQIAALCGATGRPCSASVDPGRPMKAADTTTQSGETL